MGGKNDSRGAGTYLLLPCLQLLHQEVVPLRDLGQLGVHAAFEVDKVLPSLEGIPRVLIPFTDNFIEMPHRDLRHQRLLHGASEKGFNPGISSLYLSRQPLKLHGPMRSAAAWRGILTSFSPTWSITLITPSWFHHDGS